jgi:hypothetical protein
MWLPDLLVLLFGSCDYFMIATLPIGHHSFKQLLAQVVFSNIPLPLSNSLGGFKVLVNLYRSWLVFWKVTSGLYKTSFVFPQTLLLPVVY